MHVLEQFRYCPKCGSSHFVEASEKSRKCENCGFEFYLNPAAAVAAFILNSKNELLVERRKLEPAKGMLDLPGGFCDMGETVEQAMKREIKEETALDVVDMKYQFSQPNVYRFSGFDVRTLDMFFLCKVADETQLKASDDAAECFWLPLSEIHTEQFGLRSVRRHSIHSSTECWADAHRGKTCLLSDINSVLLTYGDY